MTPQEDARVLIALVDRHLRALRLNLDPSLLSLQPYAVEARYEEGPFPLRDDRSLILEQIGALRSQLEQELVEG